MNWFKTIRFQIGLWGMRGYFPYIYFHTDNPDRNGNVDAIIYASSEETLNLYATRRDWRESHK